MFTTGVFTLFDMEDELWMEWCCVWCEWYNEGLSFARKMSVLVFMVGEIGWGEKGVAKLLGNTYKWVHYWKTQRFAKKVREKKEVSEVSKNITSPKVTFLGKPRNTSVNGPAIGRLYIYEHIFYILFFESSCYASVIFLAEYERSRLALWAQTQFCIWTIKFGAKLGEIGAKLGERRENPRFNFFFFFWKSTIHPSFSDCARAHFGRAAGRNSQKSAL